MKQYITVIVIVIFLALLGVGLIALNDQLFVKSQAGTRCPVPAIPEGTVCPEGTTHTLVRDGQGCYSFTCK